MRKEFFQEIEIPSEVEININGNLVSVKGKEGENSRKFDLGKIKMEKKGNLLFIGDKQATKKEKKKINTTTAHIRNMISGVAEKFVYELKICFVHFPMTVEISGNNVIIKNFLGEKTPRKCKIPEGAEAKIDKEIITVTSHNKELAGQAAANFEKATRISTRDRRVFQDGIFITKKHGREI
jgi:large subunit ribosomal protein L6